MAEEVRDAGRYVPISIFWSYIGNGIMAIIFLITYLFAIDNVDDALADPSGFPFIHVFSTAVNTAGVNGLTSMVLIIVVAAIVISKRRSGGMGETTPAATEVAGAVSPAVEGAAAATPVDGTPVVPLTSDADADHAAATKRRE